MIIAIGSNNKTKVQAVKEAFVNYEARFVTALVPSGVSEQPYSDEETIQGAINRGYAALKESSAMLAIGLEGGVQETQHGLFLCNFGALIEEGRKPIISGGARILLPIEVAERIRQGEELGPVMDDFTKKKDIRSREGAVGIFTNGWISRKEMFLHVAQLLVGQYEYRLKHNDTQF